jgi:hypothetical protein
VDSQDAEVARVVAVIDLLLTVGYIDGHLQDSEQRAIRYQDFDSGSHDELYRF